MITSHTDVESTTLNFARKTMKYVYASTKYRAPQITYCELGRCSYSMGNNSTLGGHFKAENVMEQKQNMS